MPTENRENYMKYIHTHIMILFPYLLLLNCLRYYHKIFQHEELLNLSKHLLHQLTNDRRQYYSINFVARNLYQNRQLILLICSMKTIVYSIYSKLVREREGERQKEKQNKNEFESIINCERAIIRLINRYLH